METFPYSIIDLTHTLAENIPTWDGSCGFKQTIKCDYTDCTTPVKFRVHQITMHSGIGTHIDAPVHCFPGMRTIDQLELNQLVAPCVVIDVSEKAHEAYSVSIADIEHFEETYGIIPSGSFVLIRTGWERFWNEPEKYRNNHRFPSVSLSAAQLLLKRNIVGLGIDTLSPDRPADEFRVHKALLGAGIYIIENVAHAAQLSALGSFIMTLPLKIAGGTEAPIRLIGLVNK